MRTRPLGWHTGGGLPWGLAARRRRYSPSWHQGGSVPTPHPFFRFRRRPNSWTWGRGVGTAAAGMVFPLSVVWGESRAVRVQVGWIRRWYQGARSLDGGLRHDTTPESGGGSVGHGPVPILGAAPRLNWPGGWVPGHEGCRTDALRVIKRRPRFWRSDSHYWHNSGPVLAPRCSENPSEERRVPQSRPHLITIRLIFGQYWTRGSRRWLNTLQFSTVTLSLSAAGDCNLAV
jgi:hypothetical protein